MPFLKSEIRHFESKFVKTGTDQCWEWLFGCMKSGYGSHSYRGKPTCTHVFAYRVYKGEIADGLYVLHTCDNRKCVNPNHLYLGTQHRNVLDMYQRGRKKMKVSPEIALALKTRYRRWGYHHSNAKQLAAEYHLDVTMVNAIVSGRYQFQSHVS